MGWYEYDSDSGYDYYEPSWFYAVAVGRRTGIYTRHEEAAAQVQGFPGFRMRKFSDYEDASLVSTTFFIDEAEGGGHPVVGLARSPAAAEDQVQCGSGEDASRSGPDLVDGRAVGAPAVEDGAEDHGHRPEKTVAEQQRDRQDGHLARRLRLVDAIEVRQRRDADHEGRYGREHSERSEDGCHLAARATVGRVVVRAKNQ
ncbi:hypothetical protein ON010_g2910 [Phytophthora cinnamomi]|nr:hypothetical protein ON010_g2910 [Phytophthora cinnamomi]